LFYQFTLNAQIDNGNYTTILRGLSRDFGNFIHNILCFFLNIKEGRTCGAKGRKPPDGGFQE
jgi:hypothetical protein